MREILYERSLCRSVLAIFVLAASGPALAQPMPLGTAFTYQGFLTEGGIAASGTYDFELKLFDSASDGNQIDGTLVLEDIVVTSGIFTIALDFGASAFAGSARWVEIGVRPGASSGAYTTLTGRQELTPVPNALYSQAAPWSGVTGKPAGFADGADNDGLGNLSCAAGELAKWNGSAWGCASTGTVTSLTAGAGLVGGTVTSSGTFSVAFAGSGSAATAARSDHNHGGVYQTQITGNCPAGSAVRQVHADGTVDCEATALHTIAACCSSINSSKICPGCTGVCGSGKVVADVAGGCSVTSDTGSCNSGQTVFGRCCVCRP
ncbi:MAG: hypothetical protein QOH06_742 [Acidobacteriota bacterium]|jgi:hypothetical protein|nr:hypothetical protein [Acidobacteriota bacterium]